MTVKYSGLKSFEIPHGHIFVTGYGAVQITRSIENFHFYVHHIEGKRWYQFSTRFCYSQALLDATHIFATTLNDNKAG